MMNWRVRSEERMDPTPEQSFSSYTSPATLRSKPAVSAGLPSEGGPYGRRASTALGVSEELYRLRLKRGRPGNAGAKRPARRPEKGCPVLTRRRVAKLNLTARRDGEV